MGIQVKTIGMGVTQVELSGSLDVSGAAQVEPEIKAAVARQAAMIIDLAEVSFVSSQGIRVIVAATKALAGKGCRTAIVNPKPEILKVLKIMNIDKIIPTFDDYQAATDWVLGAKT